MPDQPTKPAYDTSHEGLAIISDGTPEGQIRALAECLRNVIAERDQARRDLEDLTGLIAALLALDPRPCVYGAVGCTVHDHIGMDPCPHDTARELLADQSVETRPEVPKPLSPAEIRAQATGGDPCPGCQRPFNVHVCLGCSPDFQTPGRGCINCRHTGMDQTPCRPWAEIGPEANR